MLLDLHRGIAETPQPLVEVLVVRPPLVELFIVPAGFQERVHGHNNPPGRALRADLLPGEQLHVPPHGDVVAVAAERRVDVIREVRAGVIVRVEVHEDFRAFENAEAVSHIFRVAHVKFSKFRVAVYNKPSSFYILRVIRSEILQEVIGAVVVEDQELGLLVGPIIVQILRQS